MILQALIWYQQHRFEEAMSEDLRAAEVYENLGAERNLEECRAPIQFMLEPE